MTHGHAPDDGLNDPLLNQARQSAIASGQGVCPHRRVSAPQLVGAVAAEDNLDVAGREAREGIGREDRRIGDRLVKAVQSFVECAQQEWGRDVLLNMLAPQVGRHQPGVTALIELGIVEADRECLEWLRHMGGCHRTYKRGIQAATQE